MAKKQNPTERYFDIVRRINANLDVSDEDYTFFVTTTPEIDDAKIDAYFEESARASSDPNNPNIDRKLLRDGMVEAIRRSQTDPVFRERMLDIAEKAKAGKISDKLSKGIDLILGGVDIANSVSQIRASENAAKASKRPTRPTVPQRDVMLAQALRQSQENTFDTERAIAPVRAEIQDQYLNDIQGANTASTGNAGAYGAYRQLAADRRNRAAMQLAPIQDSIKAREQQRTDNLLEARANETQQMFQNQASLYPYDLQQYNYDQRTISELGQSGRESLRNSLYNMGGRAVGVIANNIAKRVFDPLRNQARAMGMNGDDLVLNRENTYRNLGMDDSIPASYWEQLYGGQ